MKSLLNMYINKPEILKYALLVIVLLIFSCTKDDSCDGCNNPNQPPINNNMPPIANAGPDQVVIIPDGAKLNGSASSDPDGTISAWLWEKISGPDTFYIYEKSLSTTFLDDLIVGEYVFQLKVTDDKGLSATDQIKITVREDALFHAYPCTSGDRPQVISNLVPLGSLSKQTLDFAIATINSKIVFAGGVVLGGGEEGWGTTKVDIYDTNTGQWSTAQLSKGRHGIASAVLANKIFFAGGAYGDGAWDLLFTTVDIYDASTNTWSVANLSMPRAYISAATVGNKVIFAGGEWSTNYDTTQTVDIYDLDTNTWSIHILSEARAYVSAVTVDNKVFFAGGQKEDRWYAQPSSRIDIYDNTTGTWSTSSLSNPMGFITGISNGQNIYWSTSACKMEIKEVNNWSSNEGILFESYEEATFDKRSIGLKDDKIIFIRSSIFGTNKFDIYDIKTNSWSVGILPQIVYNVQIVVLNNTMYLISSTYLWKLEF